MRLLYGVQATGNGHISRARAMAKYLQAHDIKVDFLFSGRKLEQFFDMQCFGNCQYRRGLTFISQAGKINYWQSFQQADLKQLWRDICALDTRHYDLVITDFEPVTAWAAKRQGTPILAIGHQYAFLHQIPLQDDCWLSRTIFRQFAPAQRHIGLHWHHFNFSETQLATIAPPIIDLPNNMLEPDPKRVLVYLPFEDTAQVLQWLLPIKNYQFDIYGCPALQSACHHGATQQKHLTFHPPSVETFKKHLSQATAVISNAGFELISEALQWQKKILVKPLQGQMEQASNALALAQLELAHRQNLLNTDNISAWLDGPVARVKVNYPNVAEEICHQLKKNGDFTSRAMWAKTTFL